MRYIRSSEMTKYLNSLGYETVETVTQKVKYEASCGCLDCYVDKMAKEMSFERILYGVNISKADCKKLGVKSNGSCKTIWRAI